MVFSTRIFRNLDLGIEWVLRCKAMELESLRCIVSRLERVVVVKRTYVLFSLETQSPKGHLNIYTTLVLSISSVEREVLLKIIRLDQSILIPYGKYLFSVLLRFLFMIPMKKYISNRME